MINESKRAVAHLDAVLFAKSFLQAVSGFFDNCQIRNTIQERIEWRSLESGDMSRDELRFCLKHCESIS